MVRAALSAGGAEVVSCQRVASGFSRTNRRRVRLMADATYACCLVLLCGLSISAQPSAPAGAAAVADAIVWGLPMAPAAQTSDLPRNVQQRLADYRQRERLFRSALTPPPGATAVEHELFDKRVAIERVLFCLFPRKDIARVAAGYASDADVSYEWEGASDPPRREAAFIDGLLRDLQQPWLAPYLDLIAGHRKLCASQLQGGESEANRAAMGWRGRPLRTATFACITTKATSPP